MMMPKKKTTPKKPAKMGRPSKYKPEYCQDIIDFFIRPLTMKNPELPFFSAYSRKIDVNTDTLHEWRKVHPDFSDAYNKCKQIQEEVLAKYGLNSGFNPTFSIFTAKNILGWRDIKEVKQEIKTKHDISPALADMFNKIYKKET